jgi:hypothetical protein
MKKPITLIAAILIILSTVILTGCGESATQTIQVSTPTPNAIITSPLNIEGKAQGTWYFEAIFPVKLVDSKGYEIASCLAQADGLWMTEKFVPFKCQLNFIAETHGTGKVIFEKSNPSDLPENDGSFEVPVSW